MLILKYDELMKPISNPSLEYTLWLLFVQYREVEKP